MRAKLQVHENVYTRHFCNYVLILIPDILHIAFGFKHIGLGIPILFLGNHIYNPCEILLDFSTLINTTWKPPLLISLASLRKIFYY